MDKKQIARLKRLIRSHVNARIELAFKGAAHPDDWEYIEQSAKEASNKLFSFIKSLEELTP